MNVLIWATTFGGDLWSLARHLDARPGVRLRIVMDDPDAYRREGVASLYPMGAELVERRWSRHLPSRKWDVTVLDNRLPLFRTSRKAFVQWHGFGWKGPNDVKEFWLLHTMMRSTWGDIRTPNPDVIWQTFGPTDHTHRTTVSGIHAENCRMLGSASHDDLIRPIDRATAQPFYPIDIVGRKTVLVAPTWHYGALFAHWGRSSELLERLIDRIDALGANTILRLHDSFRYDRHHLAFLESLSDRHPQLLLKFKDSSPDNILDMQVSDVLVTNFSSIANQFYATRRPTLHIYPVRDADGAFVHRTLRWNGVRKRRIDRARTIWKMPLEDNGGLLARSPDQLFEQLEQALADPDCCAQAATDFLDRHMLGADGHSCDRIWSALEDLVGEPTGVDR